MTVRFDDREGHSVADIPCDAISASTGEPCRRRAEWRQVETGRLVCHVHRFSTTLTPDPKKAALDAAYAYITQMDERGIPDQGTYPALLTALEQAGYDVADAWREYWGGMAAPEMA